MQDDKILLIPSEENHVCQHHNHHGHHHHMRKRMCFIGLVMAATISISFIIILGSSLGIHQKNSLIHGNNIINSSIIINIIVDGQNRTKSLIDELFDDSDYDTPEIDNENNMGRADISRGPLRVENIDQIPILRDMFTGTTTEEPNYNAQ